MDDVDLDVLDELDFKDVSTVIETMSIIRKLEFLVRSSETWRKYAPEMKWTITNNLDSTPKLFSNIITGVKEADVLPYMTEEEKKIIREHPEQAKPIMFRYYDILMALTDVRLFARWFHRFRHRIDARRLGEALNEYEILASFSIDEFKKELGSRNKRKGTKLYNEMLADINL